MALKIFLTQLNKIVNKYARVCMLLVLIAFSSNLLSQPAVLSGKLIDEKGAPVSYANVTLLKTLENSFAAASLSDSAGYFSFPSPVPGQYLLRITAIGFKEKKTDVFEVAANAVSKDFGSINLSQETKALNDVTITALRPTIVQMADRMVVNIEGTAMAQGSNAFSVLSKAPGVFIDNDGNIQLNGRSGVTVMLDGKLTYLSARDLRNLLEGMSAENIKNIEIITNPSSKYDAEGTSGILNINLKKNTQQGMNGSVYSGYTYNFRQHGYTYGGNINFKSGKWNSFLNLDAARRVGGREATFTRVFYGTNKTTYFDQVATGNFKVDGPPSVRFGSDYNITPNHSIGFMGYFNTNTAHQEFLTETHIGEIKISPTQFIDADNYSTNTFKNYTSNLHYNGKLDTVGTTLSLDLDFVKISNRGYADYYNYFKDLVSGQTVKELLYQNTPNGYNIYSAKIDFTYPVKKEHKIESGVKVSRVISDNDFRFYFNNGALVEDLLRTNHFYYKENIYAGYMNWSGPISKKLLMQTGVRAEETVSDGKSFTTGDQTKRRYLNLFPSVFLQHKVSDNYGVNYSYSRRLTRPNYGNLNPFRAYRDPYTWSQGNPYLRPQYTHAFSIAQVFKKVYNLTISYNLNKDVMAEIPILDVNNAITIYTTGNVNTGHSVSLTGVGPLKIAKWWDSQNTLLLSYNKFSMHSNLGLLENDQLFAMLQSNHTIQMPKQVRMELNILLRGPAASGLYHMAAMHRIDVAFKRSFANKKLDITLNANDIFKGYRFFWTTDIGGNVNEFDQYFRFRSIGASIRYNFSKGQKVNVKQRNSIEELNRL